MSDLIDRQAAIDVVEHITSSMSVCINTDECHGMKRMQRQAVIELANLPSAQQWIPVTDGLPEENTDVLISYRYKEGEGDTSHMEIDITSYGDMYFGGNAVHDFDGKRVKHWRQPFAYFTQNYEVVAWMPLPEPWKGEEK